MNSSEKRTPEGINGRALEFLVAAGFVTHAKVADAVKLATEAARVEDPPTIGDVSRWERGPCGIDVWTIQPAFGDAFQVTRYAPTEKPNMCFGTAADLAEWLDSLNCTNDDGAVTSEKWEPAQVAARAVRANLAWPGPAVSSERGAPGGDYRIGMFNRWRERAKELGFAGIAEAVEAHAERARVPDDTRRLEFLIKHHLRVKRLADSDLWMVLSHDGHPSTGGEYDDWREAIDEAMLAAAPSQPEDAA